MNANNIKNAAAQKRHDFDIQLLTLVSVSIVNCEKKNENMKYNVLPVFNACTLVLHGE